MTKEATRNAVLTLNRVPLKKEFPRKKDCWLKPHFHLVRMFVQVRTEDRLVFRHDPLRAGLCISVTTVWLDLLVFLASNCDALGNYRPIQNKEKIEGYVMSIRWGQV